MISSNVVHYYYFTVVERGTSLPDEGPRGFHHEYKNQNGLC